MFYIEDIFLFYELFYDDYFFNLIMKTLYADYSQVDCSCTKCSLYLYKLRQKYL